MHGGIPDTNLSQPQGPSFFLFVWDCPAAVCYLKVPLCLMLISVVFVLYYSYTLCLWMLRFQRFETMDKMPRQSFCPGAGQMVAALPIGFTPGEEWKSSPGARNQQKAPELLHWECSRKSEDRKSEALPHVLPVASGPPVSPQHPQSRGTCTRCCSPALHEAQGTPWAAVKFSLVKHSQDTILFKARFNVYEYI